MRKSIQQIVAGTLASSLLFQSCGQGFFIDEDVIEMNRKLAQNLHKSANYNTIAIPLEMNLSEENLLYLDFLQKLTSDIIDNAQIASEFLNNPAKYLTDNGIVGVDVSLDEGMLKLVTMLADEDICQAIKTNDFKGFLNLCKERNFVSMIKQSDITKINEIIENNKDAFIAINQAMAADGSIDWDILEGTPFSAIAVALAVLLIVVGVGVVMGAIATHFLGVTALRFGVASDHWIVAQYGWTQHVTSKGAGTCSNPLPFITNTDPYLLQIWTLKNADFTGTYIMANEYDEMQITDFVTTLYEAYPDAENQISRDKLTQFIALNISKFYNLYGDSSEY
jgi:hypothetical protein